MSKRKDKKRTTELYNNLIEMSAGSQSLATISDQTAAHSLKQMGKFRFQLLHQWIIEHVEPCRVADIGGGKGLLSFLLQQSGWEATVIDPVNQTLPDKYKDLAGKRIRIPLTARVPHADREFESAMAQDFDLLVGMHAHGCNVKIIEGAAQFGCGFVLLPCCVIDEPIYPRRGVYWLQCLLDYAIGKELTVQPFQLNFSGQNIGFYAKGTTARMRNQGLGL
jgi:hypothetical protein